MISPRLAPQVIGMGLLEAIPEATSSAAADPDDADGDGISGRPNWVWNPAPERPSSAASVGRPTSRRSSSRSPARSSATSASRRRSTPSRSAPDPDRVRRRDRRRRAGAHRRPARRRHVLHPHPRRPGDARRRRRRRARRAPTTFASIGCSSCHTPTHAHGRRPTSRRSPTRRFIPYTDLLLHDMGDRPGRRPSRLRGERHRSGGRRRCGGSASIDEVNGDRFLLHDGRAAHARGGDPVARRRGRAAARGVPDRCRRRSRGAAGLPGGAVRRLAVVGAGGRP